jgi:mevalonate kinase
MKVFAPGKLVLSGEHAVLYGNPALAMAINRYVVATITEEMLPQILFDLADLAHRSTLSIHSLTKLKERIKRKYHRFVRGEYSIRQVLQKPFELAQVALGIFAGSLNLSLPHGVKIHVQSDIPIGCGMGSSAATIICVMHAIARYLKVPLTSDALFQLALETENMQHGHSSGLDLRMALHGGCLYVSDTTIEERALPKVPMTLINTGKPQTTTGQCVESVAPYFKTGTLGDEFSAITKDLDRALQNGPSKNITGAIRANHQLLKTIGVVPHKVQQFISQIEEIGGAAKICGAGAVSGDQGGIVLALVTDESELNVLCQQFNYSSFKVTGETRGVHAI